MSNHATILEKLGIIEAAARDIRTLIGTPTQPTPNPDPQPAPGRIFGYAGSFNQQHEQQLRALGANGLRGYEMGPVGSWPGIKRFAAAGFGCFVTIQPREFTTAEAERCAEDFAEKSPAGVIAGPCNEPDLAKYRGPLRTLEEVLQVWAKPFTRRLRQLRGNDVLIATPSLGDMNPDRLPANVEMLKAWQSTVQVDFVDAHAYASSMSELTRILDEYSWVPPQGLTMSECMYGWAGNPNKRPPLSDSQVRSIQKFAGEAFKLFAQRSRRVFIYRLFDTNGTGYEQVAPITRAGQRTEFFDMHRNAVAEALK